jgi:hypothetical protein
VLAQSSSTFDAHTLAYLLGPNDSKISRGDRADTGDNEARPTEKGSGWAQPTVDDSAVGGNTSISHSETSRFDIAQERDSRDGLEIMQPEDGRLGLTNVGDVPADDWAADTGETKSSEGS